MGAVNDNSKIRLLFENRATPPPPSSLVKCNVPAGMQVGLYEKEYKGKICTVRIKQIMILLQVACSYFAFYDTLQKN